MTTGDAGNTNTSSYNLSSTSASYTGRIGNQYDNYDYYNIDIAKSHHISVRIESSNAEVNISLYDQSMVLLDSNNSLSAEPIVSTNLTSSSSARNIFIVIEKINSTGDYHMNLTYYTQMVLM